MLTGTLFILLAWFVKMPLWLSVLSTIFGGLIFLGHIARICQNANEKV